MKRAKQRKRRPGQRWFVINRVPEGFYTFPSVPVECTARHIGVDQSFLIKGEIGKVDSLSIVES